MIQPGEMHVPALLSVSNLVFCRNSLLPFLEQMLLTSPSSRSPFTGLFVHLDEFTHITSVGAQLCLNKPPLMVGICFLHLPATGFCTDWTGSVEFKLLPTINSWWLSVISYSLLVASKWHFTMPKDSKVSYDLFIDGKPGCIPEPQTAAASKALY